MKDRIYADFNATCPVSSVHLEKLVDRLKASDGNPSSIHSFGREAKVVLENCRGEVARLLGCDDQEIIFTSGATESNNLAVQGVVGRQTDKGSLPSVVLSAIEHSSILGPAHLLAERGLCEVRIAPVDRNGRIDERRFLDLVDDRTVFAAAMAVNNEVGTINDVEALAAKVKDHSPRCHFHCDAVQALGKLDLTWTAKSRVDSAALSSHKIGGLKGCGALFLRRGHKLNVLIAGGGQERSRRGGTENIPGIFSFGIRAEELRENPHWIDHCKALKIDLLSCLGKDDRIRIHGDPSLAVGNTVNFHVEGIRGEDILLNLDLAGIAVSSGSACSSGANRPSSVLLAMGYSEWEALNSIRVSFGETSQISDVKRINDVLQAVIKRR